MCRRKKQALAWSLALVVLGVAAACGDPYNPITNHRNTPLTDSTHDTYFPISFGAHKGMDCNLCHGSFDSFKGFTCIGCHAHDKAPTDAAHPDAPGYTYTATSCYLCHANGLPLFNMKQHQALFPIGPQTGHDKESCAECHSDPNRVGEKAFATCGTCHAHSKAATLPFHTQPLDGGGPVGSLYQWGVNTCLDCHVDGRMLMRANHSVPKDANGNNVAMGPHFQVTCTACHQTRKDFKSFTCGPCHNPGGSAAATTAACDTANGSPCTDTQKYHYFYK